MRQPRIARRERGFLIIAGVFLIVVLAGLVGYLMTVSTTSQAASAADANSARAYQVARAGAEWGAYQILRDPAGGTYKSTCETGPGFTATFNLNPAAATHAGFTATVVCSSASLSEGGTAVIAYRIVSTGCNQPACPAGISSSTYVERQVSLTVTSN